MQFHMFVTKLKGATSITGIAVGVSNIEPNRRHALGFTDVTHDFTLAAFVNKRVAAAYIGRCQAEDDAAHDAGTHYPSRGMWGV